MESIAGDWVTLWEKSKIIITEGLMFEGRFPKKSINTYWNRTFPQLAQVGGLMSVQIPSF